ncbi:MAG: M23 family metallopeptidase [Nitrosomonas sp.]|nr:M23 family metallopeptidase [Nitrosomonas sp.]
MNIILISNKSARSKKVTLTGLHLTLITGAFLIFVMMLTLGLNYFSLRYADKIKTPVLKTLLMNPQEERHQKSQENLQNNLNMMAVKLGQMQAQLLRLDALGVRLAESSGIDPHDFHFSEPPGQGGSHSHSHAEESVTFNEFKEKIDWLSYMLDERTERLGALDSFLRGERLTKRVLPSTMPVDSGWFSSGFGYRIDPFSGKRVFHQGVDFAAKVGTPIKAAASGIVVYSAHHAEYGNMIEIDHGDDLVSRYAHASKRLVDLGQVVLQGQKIAEVGNTGRSTGPHLHFEIRHKNKPQNPFRFLKRPG